MCMAPFALPNARYGYRMNNGTLIDLMIKDGLWKLLTTTIWELPRKC